MRLLLLAALLPTSAYGIDVDVETTKFTITSDQHLQVPVEAGNKICIPLKDGMPLRSCVHVAADGVVWVEETIASRFNITVKGDAEIRYFSVYDPEAMTAISAYRDPDDPNPGRSARERIEREREARDKPERPQRGGSLVDVEVGGDVNVSVGINIGSNNGNDNGGGNCTACHDANHHERKKEERDRERRSPVDSRPD